MSTKVEAPRVASTSAVPDAEELRLLGAQVERMTQLADLAHKINNPLTSVMGRAQLLRMKRQTDPNVLKALDVIDEATARITGYIREVAAIVRDGKAEIIQRLADQVDEVAEDSEVR